MNDLKLGKLPDRTPVKLTITLAPSLHQALQAYAELYRATYGQAEPVTELIPYMLERFLASDRRYTQAHKGRAGEVVPGDGATASQAQPRRAASRDN